MRNDRSKTILALLCALVFALFMTPSVLAGEKAEKAGTKEVKQALEQPVQQAADPQLEVQPVAPVQEAADGAGEPPDGEIEPPAEPQAVLKNKTKSNQSND